MSNAAKSFDILATSLFVPHNYFNGLTKLFFTASKFLYIILEQNRFFDVKLFTAPIPSALIVIILLNYISSYYYILSLYFKCVIQR